MRVEGLGVRVRFRGLGVWVLDVGDTGMASIPVTLHHDQGPVDLSTGSEPQAIVALDTLPTPF